MVLLVEDDTDVRGVTRRVLQQNGCDVIEAGSAREALECWSQHRDRVDLLLTDVRLRDGLDGCELARRLRVEKPQLRVLFTSGHGQETGIFTRTRGDTECIGKPYDSVMLTAALQAAFEKSEGSLQP